MIVCGGLAAPLLLQPALAPQLTAPDDALPLLARHATRANAWVAIFSFIGNYWCDRAAAAARRASSPPLSSRRVERRRSRRLRPLLARASKRRR